MRVSPPILPRPQPKASAAQKRSVRLNRSLKPTIFDVEYWPLELAKLGQRKPLPLAGQIAVITGAGGTIGAATARAFADAGAEVALLDIDADAAA